MGFEITPTALELKELLPDVAAKMEEKIIRSQLAALKVVHHYSRQKGTLVIEIELSNGFYMRLRPVDVGPGNFHEFFSVVKTPQLRLPDGKRIPAGIKESIRMHVEIYDGSIANCFSHTLHQDSLEKLIKAALEGFYQTRNIKLAPIALKRKPRRSKPRVVQPPLED